METKRLPKLVFTCGFDERTASEAELKGWFDAVRVSLPSGLEVPLSFRDPVRLSQDLDAAVSEGRACVAEPGSIVIPKVTRANMEAAVVELYEEGFFEQIASIGRVTGIPKGVDEGSTG